MKFLLLTLAALIGFAAAAQVPDSATQGPNPQDIATPEPEYIDIDEPLPAAAPAPAPVQTRAFAPRPIPAPISFARSIAQSYAPPQQQHHYQPQPQQQQHHYQPQPQQQQHHYQPQQQQQIHYQAPVQQSLPGHTFSRQSGYQYRRPVFVRRVYRRRY